MRAGFLREYQAYQAALEGSNISFDDYVEASIKLAAVSAQFAAERAAAAALFESKKEELERLFQADPEAEFTPRELAAKLGLPATRGFHARISYQIRELKLLRDHRRDSEMTTG